MLNEQALVNEITELFSNKNKLQNDFMEAYDMMRRHIHNKYVAKMMETVENYQEKARKNPSAEISLLKAWKPFVPEESHERINGLIDMFEAFNTIKHLRNGFGDLRPASTQETSGALDTSDTPINAASKAEGSSSVHPDGVYDIDEQCRLAYYSQRNAPGFDSIAGMLMLFALTR